MCLEIDRYSKLGVGDLCPSCWIQCLSSILFYSLHFLLSIISLSDFSWVQDEAIVYYVGLFWICFACFVSLCKAWYNSGNDRWYLLVTSAIMGVFAAWNIHHQHDRQDTSWKFPTFPEVSVTNHLKIYSGVHELSQ